MGSNSHFVPIVVLMTLPQIHQIWEIQKYGNYISVSGD